MLSDTDFNTSAMFGSLLTYLLTYFYDYVSVHVLFTNVLIYLLTYLFIVNS